MVFANDHFLSLSLSIILGGLFVVVVFFIHIIKLVKSMTWILNFFSFLGMFGLLKHFFVVLEKNWLDPWCNAFHLSSKKLHTWWHKHNRPKTSCMRSHFTKDLMCQFFFHYSHQTFFRSNAFFYWPNWNPIASNLSRNDKIGRKRTKMKKKKGKGGCFKKIMRKIHLAPHNSPYSS